MIPYGPPALKHYLPREDLWQCPGEARQRDTWDPSKPSHPSDPMENILSCIVPRRTATHTYQQREPLALSTATHRPDLGTMGQLRVGMTQGL